MHPCSLIDRNLHWPSLDAMNFGYPQSAQQRFRSARASALADLNLCWAHVSNGTFPHVVAPIMAISVAHLTGSHQETRTQNLSSKDKLHLQYSSCVGKVNIILSIICNKAAM